MLQTVTRRYRIDEVEPGLELAGNLVTDNGRFALGEGTVLTASLIQRLRGWGVEVLDVKVTTEVKVKEPPPLSEAQQLIAREYDETVAVLRKSFQTIRFFKEVPLSEMREIAAGRLEPLINTSGVLNHLHVIHRRDDYTFHHSINVAVICGVLGRWLGYKGGELADLILAGLMHDIGKTQIKLEILRKPGKLTAPEMKIMMLHTTRGYNLVKELELPTGVLCAILQHHEREDGSGYPLQVGRDKIHPFAQVVAVADIYDAMTSETVYRRKLTPFAAVETLIQDMYNKLEPHVCTVFLNNVRDYFIGNVVELSDGREAEVVYLGKFISARPVVRAEDGEFIDLDKKHELSIVKLIRA